MVKFIELSSVVNPCRVRVDQIAAVHIISGAAGGYAVAVDLIGGGKAGGSLFTDFATAEQQMAEVMAAAED